MLLYGLFRRRALDLLFCLFELPEGGRLVHPEADEQPHEGEWSAHEKRYAPAPGGVRCLPEASGDGEDGKAAQE